MSSIKKILVGVDLHHADRIAAAELNPPTLTAIQRSIWLASHLNAEIEFVAVLDVGANTQELLHEHFKEQLHSVEEESRDVLKDLVEQAQKEGVTAKWRLMYGRPWYELLKVSVQDEVDLVVVGTKDMGKAGRVLLGSTAIKLLRKCTCPVWVTKPDPNPSDLNVLVCSDLTEVSQNLLHMIVDTCKTIDAKVHLLHANDAVADHGFWNLGVDDAKLVEHQKQIHAEKERLLQEQLANTDYRTLTYGVKVHVVDGTPEYVIPKVMEEEKIDLIALGTIARSGIPGMIFGNTAERLLSEIGCSILAIKPEGFECPVHFDD